jgi:hypothetical protein
MELAKLARQRIGLLVKVLPTALVAAAMRPSIARRELEGRVGALIETLGAAGANLATSSARQAVEEGTTLLAGRNVIVVERGRCRVRERSVLRYYARSIQHLLATPRRAARTH